MRRNRQEERMGMNAPSMTEHLQNLDLELQLLKRKREMIEQQQRLFNQRGQGYDRQKNFNFNSSQQSNSNRSFQNSYDDYDEAKPFSRNYGQSSRKRSGGPTWHDRSPPKRFSGPNKNNARKAFGTNPGQTGPRSKNTSQSQSDQRRPQPLSLMDVPTNPMIFNQKPSNQHNQPSKSSGVSFKSKKPFKAANKNQPPNKLGSYPEAQRRALVTEASSLSIPANKTELILHPDKEPTLQMTGRLELALGNLTKQIRERYEDDERIAPFLLSQYTLRSVKREIRVRLRNAMLGKVVDNVNDIVNYYRAKYPPETDEEIVRLAIGVPEGDIPAPEELPETVSDLEHPVQYFKDSMRNLIDLQLDEMFKRLHELYADEFKSENEEEVDKNDSNKTHENIQIDIKRENETEVDKNDSNKTHENNQIDIKSENEKEVDKNESNKTHENSQTDKCVFENTEDFSEDVKIVEKFDQTNKNKSDKIGTADDISVDVKPDVFTIDVKPDENANNKDTSGNIESSHDFSEDVQIVDAMNKIDSNKTKPEVRELSQGAFNNRIKKRLLYVLPKYKTYIIKLLEMDKTYRETKASIIATAKERMCNLGAQKKFNKINPVHEKDGSENPVHVTDGSELIPSTQSEQRPHLNIPYFVKIMGRPSLPKRKLMQTFLDQFSPKSIKRHKNRPNLLFVGLGTKEDFDNAIAANDTVIDRYTLDIRASGSISKNQNSENSDITEPKNSETEGDQLTDSNIIGSDLDEQIDNLFSSIRKSEEDLSVLIQENTEEIIEIPDESEEIQETIAVESAEVEGEKSTNDSKDATNMEDKTGTTMETITEENVVNVTQEKEVSATANNSKSGIENNDHQQVDNNAPTVTDTNETADNKSDNSNVIESAVVGSGESEVSNNKVEALKDEAKDTGKGSPARSTRSSNLTPSTIKTRRASRLAQNN